MNTRFTAGSRRPPQDREYATLVDAGELVLLRTIDQDGVRDLREEFESPPIEQIIGDRPIGHESLRFPRPA